MSTGKRAVPSHQEETAKSLCLETGFSSTNAVKMPCFVCTKQLQRVLSPGYERFPYTLTMD